MSRRGDEATHRAAPRRGRTRHARAGLVALRARRAARASRRRHRPRGAGRRRRAARRRPLARLHHRRSRRRSALLPGRRHRTPRRVRRGQRPRHDGRHRGARALALRDAGGGPAARAARAHPGLRSRRPAARRIRACSAATPRCSGRGELDGIVLSSAAIGFVREGRAPVRDCTLRPGDEILVSGTLGDHGMAVMARRHELACGPEEELRSDVAPLNGLVRGRRSRPAETAWWP